MNKRFLLFCSLAVASSVVFTGVIGSQFADGFVSNAVTNDCSLIFNKNSIFNDKDGAKGYIQEGTLLLETNKVHKDENGNLFIASGGYIKTSGQAYSEESKWGSVANGLKTITFNSDNNANLDLYTCYNYEDETSWTDTQKELNQDEFKFPQRYFKLENNSKDRVILDFINIKCSANEKLLSKGEELIGGTINGTLYIGNGKFEETINDYELVIDDLKEEIHFKRYDEKNNQLVDTILKPLSYEEDEYQNVYWNLVDIHDSNMKNPKIITFDDDFNIYYYDYNNGSQITISFGSPTN